MINLKDKIQIKSNNRKTTKTINKVKQIKIIRRLKNKITLIKTLRHPKNKKKLKIKKKK